MSILKLLNNKGFISYNKAIAKLIGIHEAILLGELCSIADLFGGEEFFFTQDKLSNDTCLSEYQINKALKKLQEFGIVSIRKKGIPCKNYYTVNEKQILKMLECQGTSSQETKELETEKLEDLQTKNSSTTSKNTEVKIQSKNTSKKSSQQSFKKPTLEEIKEYCKERNNSVDPEHFYDYYESNGWTVGRNKMKDWKATIRNWEKNEKSWNKTKYKNNNPLAYQDEEWSRKLHSMTKEEIDNLF